MSLHFVSGRPGAGKSLYAMRLIVEELRRGTRCVVTNVAVKLPELNCYLQDDNSDVMRRVRILSFEETQRFWLYRGESWDVVPPGERERLNFGRCRRAFKGCDEQTSAFELGGVCYVIDEIHLYFGSRDWATTGKDAHFYMTQHRKLGDDVIGVTQAVEQVDVAFRRLAEDFTYVQNLSKRRVFGFQMPSRFLTGTYLKPFTGAVGERAMYRTVFTLDAKGLANTYDTAAGFGVTGRMADVGARRKGRPFWMGVATVLGIAFAVWFGLVGFARWGSRLWASEMPAIPSSSQTAATPPPPQPEPAGNAVGNYVQAAIQTPRQKREDEPVYMTGLVGGDGRAPLMVTLSDGRVFRAGDHELQFVSKAFCIVEGVTCKWSRISR